MTQGGPPPPADYQYMTGGLPAMDFGGISPRQEFINPFPAGARKSRQMDYDDLPQRISGMNLEDDMYVDRKRSQSRKRSVSRPRLKRSSTISVFPQELDYEQYRFEKIGEDWTDAKRTRSSASQKNLRKKAKSGRSKNGTVLEQMTNMVQTRRGQIDELLEDKNLESDFEWEPVYIEEVKAGMNRTTGKKSVMVMDVIIGRVGLTSQSRPSLAQVRTNSGSRPNSIFRANSMSRSKSVSRPTSILRRNSMSANRLERGVLRDRANSWDRYNDERSDKKDKEKDGGGGKQGGGKYKEVIDPDPFGTSKLFAPSGKPLDTTNGAHIPFDEVVLPPHIKEEEPIGRILNKKRSGSRGGKGQAGDDAYDGLQILDENGVFSEGGAAEILDNMDFDDILPKSKSKSKGKKGGRSRSRSKSRGANGGNRSRSKSRSRSRARAEQRGKRRQRVDEYMDDRSSRSSDHGSGRSVFLDEDDNTSFTSSSIHRDMDRRGSLHRRGSSKHEKHQYREHYRGPARDSRGYFGEQIIISPQRPVRRLSNSYALSAPKAITYGEPWYSGQRSPDLTRDPSPRRREYGVPTLLYPHEEDQRSERYVDSYMDRDRIDELRQRELDERERALERKERELRRASSYGNPYVRRGKYQ